MSDDDKKATDAASVADTIKHIGGSESESSPHTRSANALADGIASQSLGAPFQYQGNVADGKNGSSNENKVVADVAVEKPQTADGVESLLQNQREIGHMPASSKHRRFAQACRSVVGQSEFAGIDRAWNSRVSRDIFCA